jgi:hypothetical protein
MIETLLEDSEIPIIIERGIKVSRNGFKDSRAIPGREFFLMTLWSHF